MSIHRASIFSRGERGQAAVEVGLLLPWMVFSFIGVLDFGCAAYAMIATQNAARVGAMWGAAANATTGATFTSKACNYALGELKYAPNMASVSTCTTPSPVSVTATSTSSGADGLPTVTVSVTYTVSLLSIPGLMPGSLAITRSVQMPVM
ncbi:MAG: TadE family protein [Bryobacteraceae bacterium]|jgi:Flp pilus assembly protein TadG